MGMQSSLVHKPAAEQLCLSSDLCAGDGAVCIHGPNALTIPVHSDIPHVARCNGRTGGGIVSVDRVFVSAFNLEAHARLHVSVARTTRLGRFE